MKAILMSIKPKWCEKVFSGEKTIEVRKTAPKETPFKVYVYCSNGDKLRLVHSLNTDGVSCMVENDEFVLNYILNGKVIGEFVCNDIDMIVPDFQYGYLNYLDIESTCLSVREMEEYGKGKPLYGWHISDLKIYDKPRGLCEFTAPCKQHKTKPDESCKGCPYIFKGMTSGKLTCDRALTRAPQSWQYVEER